MTFIVLSAGNTFTTERNASYILYYTIAGVIIIVLLCLFFIYVIIRARSHGSHPSPPRIVPPPPRPPTGPPTGPPRVTRPSRFVPTKTTLFTQPPPGYLTVVGSPAYQLEKSIRPGITLPPFAADTQTAVDEEPPPYPDDMDELNDTYQFF